MTKIYSLTLGIKLFLIFIFFFILHAYLTKKVHSYLIVLIGIFSTSPLYAITIEEQKNLIEKAHSLYMSDPTRAEEIYSSLLAKQEPETQKILPREQLSIYFEALDGLASLHTNQSNYPVAITYSEQLYDLAKLHGDTAMKGEAVILRGYIEHIQNHFKQARNFYDLGLEFGLESNHKELIALSYDRISSLLRSQDKNNEALIIALDAVDILKEAPKSEQYLNALKNLSILYGVVGDFESALKGFSELHDKSVAQGFSKGIADSIYEMGEIYGKMSNWEQALQYFQTSYELDIKNNNQFDIANSATKIAQIAVNMENFELALEYLDIAEPLYTVMGNKIGLGNVKIFRSRIATGRKNYDLAEEYANTLMDFATEHQSRGQILAAGFLLMDLAKKRGHIDKAIVQGLSTKVLAYQSGETDKILLINKELSGLYAKSGDHKKAFEHLKAYISTREKIDQNQYSKAVATMQNKSEIMRKKQQIELLNAEKALQASQLRAQSLQFKASFFAITCLLLMIAAFVYRLYKKRRTDAERALFLQQVVDKKNQLLADVSHEVRTPLTALQLQVEALQFNIVEDVDASYTNINRKLGDINRLIGDIYQLAKIDSGTLDLQCSEIRLIEQFALWETEFESFIVSQGFEWQFNNLLTKEIAVFWDPDRIKQLLMNLISNSTFYTDKPGIIQVTLSESASDIIIEVEDSSPGVSDNDLNLIFDRLFRGKKSKQRQKDGSGLGLSICKSLVQAHAGSIEAKHSHLGGLKLIIAIPSGAKKS